MQDKAIQIIFRSLSQPRIVPYYSHVAEELTSVLARYFYNIAVCQALYSPLHLLEITLRNQLHQVFTDEYGSEGWYDLPVMNRILRMNEHHKIRKVQEDLRKIHKNLDPCNVITELSFGFWTSLFDSCYDIPFWRSLIAPAFPHMRRSIRTRQTLSKRLNDIRRLRNRVFHHERVLHLNLSASHAEIVEAISWMNQELASLITRTDGFQSQWTPGEEPFRVDFLKKATSA